MAKEVRYHALRNTDRGFEQILVVRCGGNMTESHVRYHKTWRAAHSAMGADNKQMWSK